VILKETARFGQLKPQLVLGLIVAESVFQRRGLDAVVTSCNDSVHGGKPVLGESQDPHYTGRAVDLRMRHVPCDQTREVIAAAIAAALGPTFRTIHESIGTENEHLHIQYEGAA
jgi:hypothetical protein